MWRNIGKRFTALSELLFHGLKHDQVFSIPVHTYSGLASLNIILHFMVEQSSNGGEWSEIIM